MQFVPDGDDDGDDGRDSPPTPLDDDQVGQLIAGLARAPLGIDAGEDADFRISVAGAQEKTALLRRGGRGVPR